MTIGDCLWAAILLFAAVHFGIIAVYTVKIGRAVIFGILAAFACALAIAMLNGFALRWYLFITVCFGANIVGWRNKVFKTFGVRRFRIGRWWQLAPFALEAAVVAVMAALYINSLLAAERFFDRLENGIDKFKTSQCGAEKLAVPAPGGSRLVFFFPYTPVAEADFPADVNCQLEAIASANEISHFALVDAMGWVFVRNDRWGFGYVGGVSRVLRWDAVNGVIRVGVAKDRGYMYLWERDPSAEPQSGQRSDFSAAAPGRLPHILINAQTIR